jgi:DNA-binding MarR family transcriptional regulator|tara:strand:- start:317 stop:607 length:291 start_codon:yes stop_codon:yes gene_type:complete
MKGFDQLNKAFESRVRLGLMSILSVNNWVSYKEIKDLLEVTDGNLASHIQSLEKINYLEIKKQFIGKKPLTTYKVTEIGKKAFKNHIEGLEKLLLK